MPYWKGSGTDILLVLGSSTIDTSLSGLPDQVYMILAAAPKSTRAELLVLASGGLAQILISPTGELRGEE